MHVIGNCLFVENFSDSDFKESEWKAVQAALGNPTANHIQTAEHLLEIIHCMGRENAETMIRIEAGNMTIKIHRDDTLHMNVIESHYVCPGDLCIAIYRVSRKIRSFLEIVNYLAKMGYKLEKVEKVGL